jgi:c-di-GMP-related signal transduction protein
MLNTRGIWMHERFIARQPIFDTRLRVYAYELLFRRGTQNFFQPPTGTSSSVIAESIGLSDLLTLIGSARAFMNADELALRLGAPRLLPADRIVVEILETVKPSPEIIKICRALRDSGYILALDDFVDAPELEPLVELAEFLKVDFQLLEQKGREHIARKYCNGYGSLALLAEKVETEEELAEARALGFRYFQGYFFCKPSMIQTHEIPGDKRLQLELLCMVVGPQLHCDAIEDLLSREPSLLYRLLRYLNAPLLGLGAEVRDIRGALDLLGGDEFRRWVSIFTVAGMSAGKPPELLRTALTRAYFCEQFSTAAGLSEKKFHLFVMGLLSILDALLDEPLAEALSNLPVAQEVKIALCGGIHRLRDPFEILLAFERADWTRLPDYVQRLGCDEDTIPNSYQSAIQKAALIST